MSEPVKSYDAPRTYPPDATEAERESIDANEASDFTEATDVMEAKYPTAKAVSTASGGTSNRGLQERASRRVNDRVPIS